MIHASGSLYIKLSSGKYPDYVSFGGAPHVRQFVRKIEMSPSHGRIKPSTQVLPLDYLFI